MGDFKKMGTIANLLIQIFFYAVVIGLALLIISFLQRGFFWKYMRVKASLGRKVLVKIRTPLTDYHAVGWVEDNFLCYKNKDYVLRLRLNNDDRVFYRWLGVNNVDVDEEKHAICKTNYTSITGYDLKAHSDLVTRALMRPAISSGKEKIVLVVVILTLLLAGGSVYLSFECYDTTNKIYAELPNKIAGAINSKGTIVPASTL